MKIELDSLEALEAVIETGSVASAADRLNKARSAISYHLRRLEERLGISILDRGGYRLALTPQGEAVLAEARIILRKSRELEHIAGRIRLGWEPHLTIHFDGALPIAWILRALEDLDKLGAPTRIELRVAFLDAVQDQFLTRGGDLMIACSFTSTPPFEAQILPSIELALCCSSQHPLADMDDVDIDDLRNHTELVIQGSDSTKGVIRPFFFSRRVFFLGDFTAKLEAIRHGLGFGWLPMHLAEADLASGSLCEVRLSSGSRYDIRPVFVTQKDRPPGPALRRIVDSLAAFASRQASQP